MRSSSGAVLLVQGRYRLMLVLFLLFRALRLVVSQQCSGQNCRHGGWRKGIGPADIANLARPVSGVPRQFLPARIPEHSELLLARTATLVP